MLRFELRVDSGHLFETFGTLGVERLLEFSGRVVSPEDRFDEIRNFKLMIKVKNTRDDVLGKGVLRPSVNLMEAQVFLTETDVNNLMQAMPAFSAKHLALSFLVLVDNSHEIFDERKDVNGEFLFHISEFVHISGFGK